MKKYWILGHIILFLVGHSGAQVRVNPNGVNVNASGATTVFLTFGPLSNQVPVEAFWCGELIDAAPSIGNQCDPGTIFGSLPVRYDLSSQSPNGTLTDIMSIPPSVARRAYQAAQQGATSSFFYVRRFVSSTGGPDEYVAVTCRLAGGGARVPLSLVDVTIKADSDNSVIFVKKEEIGPQVAAEVYYNGTGQLKGRWEIVLPGDEPPAARDLLTEASLPVDERGLQRRYTQLKRFSVFLPPTGKIILPGPDPEKLPTSVNGLYMVLLRIEASEDKEGDSNLGSIGAGNGIIHSGAVAGFPIPPFRYYVGNAESAMRAAQAGKVQLLLPSEDQILQALQPVDFSWTGLKHAALYRLEAQDPNGEPVLSALLQTGIETYRAPSWLQERAPEGALTWRVSALNFEGDLLAESDWRSFRFNADPEEE